MTTTRRTALAMLGLGTATAIGSESFVTPNAGKLQSGASSYDKERYAQTFERLANELRRDAVSIESIKLESSIEGDSIADRHELRVKFIYFPEV